MPKLAEYAKAVAAFAVSALGILLAEGLVPEQYRPWALFVVAIATTVGVYAVPNKPKPFHLDDSLI